jgi:beta-N-acetylhexosaminidase
VVRVFQRAVAASPVHAPLLLMADQEGGEVRRLPGPPALSERQIGEGTDAVSLAAQAGAGAGRTLAGAGLNVNLAPVLDVYRRPGNFIDRYQRSYSRDPAAVARLAAAFISAQQRARVAATAKHFPGLGAAAAAQNTDAAAVSLGVPLARLRAVDELPYRKAIGAGVKLVMASWATYPALDPRLPAGLSPVVMQRELRWRLGFRGVTITDAITAGSLRRFGGLGARGVLAAQAGADLILCAATNPADNSPAIGFAVLSALAHGGPGRAASEQVVARILALRKQSGPA